MVHRRSRHDVSKALSSALSAIYRDDELAKSLVAVIPDLIRDPEVFGSRDSGFVLGS